MSEVRSQAVGPVDLVQDLEQAWPGARVHYVAPIPASHSGFTYSVTAELEGVLVGAVLRLPPPGARPVGPADVARQARIMEALRTAGVPVPRVFAYTSEPAVDRRPFVLMELVDGVSVGEAVATTAPRQLVASAFETIRLMHAVPAAETGLGAESPTAIDAEVARWQALRLRAPDELVRRAPELEELLLHALPAAGNPVLVHGDYHLNNLLFKNGEVVAILDWEIAELGQGPLDEAALCLLAVREEFGEPNAGEEAALPLEEMLSLAEAGPDFDWYMAATCHKYAAILGYNLGLHRRGRRVDAIFEELLETIPGLIDAGIRFLGRS